jgi:hypothetical protein
VDFVLQTAGSLVAILVLAGLAWWLRLGGAPQLDSDEAVRCAAGEVEDGFEAISVARDAGGSAALAKDVAGRIMVIRRHGNRFAGRVLGPRASAAVAEQAGALHLVVDPAEARFGRVTLALPDPQAWAEAINRVSEPQDA